MSAFENIAIKDIVSGNDLIITAAGAAKVDGSGVVQPVSGTVTIIPSGTQAVSATDLDIRDLSQNQDSVLIYGSDDGGTTKRVIKTDSGGAIQVDLEVASVSITSLPNEGQQAMANSISVAIASDQSSLPVTGTVTANAGTNLNTSALALETTLQSVKTSVETLSGTVASNKVQVDVISLPAITAIDLDIRNLTFAADKVDASGSSVTISGSVAVTGPLTDIQLRASPVSVDTELPTAAALADNTANPTVPAVGSFGMVWDGSTWDRAPGNATDGLLVNLGSNNDVTVINTVAVSATDLDIRNLTNIDVVTAELSAVDNAVLDAIAASLAAIDIDTSTIIGHVDGIETLIGATNTNTANAVTSLQLIDDTVVTLGTDTYTEASSKGLVIGGVRRDADTTLVNTTNEFTPFQVDANGRLKVEVFSGETLPVSLTSTTITGTVAVTQSGTWNIGNSGTFVVQENGAALTALQLIDDVIFTDNNTFTDNSSKVAAIGYIYDETAGTTLTENDIAAARINANRAQVQAIEDGTTRGRYATVTAANALKVDNSGVTQPVSGTVAATQSGTWNVTNAGTFAVQATIASGATTIGKAEDLASADGDVGVPAMAIRKATPANTSGTDGDYEMLQMSAGRLWASATIDAALPAGTNAIGKLAANDGVDIGDVTINNASGASAVNIQDGGNSITVDYATIGSGTATGAIRVELPTNGTGVVGLNTGTNSIGKISDITTAVVPGTGATNLGKAEDAVAGSGDTGVFSLSVANESQSALAGDGDYIARAADTKGNSLMVGNLAHDAVDAGNPVKIGAQARQTNPTAVADGDRVNITADDLGRQVVVVGQVRDLIVDNTTTISSSTSETTILTAVASTFLDIRCLWVSNTSATAVRVDFRDATGGSVRFSLQVPAGDTRGFVVPTAIKQTTVNNNWTAQSSVSVADLRIYIQAEKNI